ALIHLENALAANHHAALDQRVDRMCDGPLGGVLDRRHAEIGVAESHSIEHTVDRRGVDVNRLAVEQPACGGMSERSGGAEECDAGGLTGDGCAAVVIVGSISVVSRHVARAPGEKKSSRDSRERRGGGGVQRLLTAIAVPGSRDDGGPCKKRLGERANVEHAADSRRRPRQRKPRSQTIASPSMRRAARTAPRTGTTGSLTNWAPGTADLRRCSSRLRRVEPRESIPPESASGTAARSSPNSCRASARACSTSSSTASDTSAFARRSPDSATLSTT